jgi:hypothetical protein
MNDGEVFALNRRHLDTGRSLRQRLHGKKRERKMRYRFPEFGSSGTVPGIDLIERFKSFAPCGVRDADQIEARIGDGSGLIGKAN